MLARKRRFCLHEAHKQEAWAARQLVRASTCKLVGLQLMQPHQFYAAQTERLEPPWLLSHSFVRISIGLAELWDVTCLRGVGFVLQACVVTLTQLAWVHRFVVCIHDGCGLSVGWFGWSSGRVSWHIFWLPTCTIWNACLCCVVWSIYLSHSRFGSHAWLHTHNWCGCTDTIQWWWWWWMLCLWVEVVDVGLGH